MLLTQFKFTFCKCRIGHQINPNDPAVIPILTKNPNSSKSLAPGGMDIKTVVSAKGSI